MEATTQDTTTFPSPSSLEDTYLRVDDLINRLGGMIVEAQGIATLLSRDACLADLESSPDGEHVSPAVRGLATLLKLAERQHDECAAVWDEFLREVQRRIPSPPVADGAASGLMAQENGGRDEALF
jgi:hypothetical protein